MKLFLRPLLLWTLDWICIILIFKFNENNQYCKCCLYKVNVFANVVLTTAKNIPKELPKKANVVSYLNSINLRLNYLLRCILKYFSVLCCSFFFVFPTSCMTPWHQDQATFTSGHLLPKRVRALSSRHILLLIPPQITALPPAFISSWLLPKY